MYKTIEEAHAAAIQMVKESVREPADVNVYVAPDGEYKVFRATVDVPSTLERIISVRRQIVSTLC